MNRRRHVFAIVTIGALIAVAGLPAAQSQADPHETLEDHGVDTGRGQVFCGEVAGAVYHCDYVLNRFPQTPHEPRPPDGATGQPKNLTLSWESRDKDDADSVTYTVRLDRADELGPDEEPTTEVCEVVDRTSCDVGGLAPKVEYRWQVTARDGGDTRVGPVTLPEGQKGSVWSFETAENGIGEMSPDHAAEEVARPVVLSWSREESTTTRYDVYMSTDPDFERTSENLVCHSTFDTECDPSGRLSLNTTYYWQVVADDGTKSARQWFEVYTTVDIDVEDDHGPACAVMSNGNGICWDEYDGGELQVDTVYTGGDAVQVSVDYDGCFRLTSGDVHCVGGPTYDGGDAVDLAPRVEGCLLSQDQNVLCHNGTAWVPRYDEGDAIDFAWEGERCVAQTNGDVDCRDNDADRTDKSADQIATGDIHICVLTTASNVDCWFDDESRSGSSYDHGQDADRMTGDVVQITAVEDSTCALTLDGNVDCWGEWSNADYSGGDAEEVAFGYEMRCVRLTSGAVDCKNLDTSHHHELDFS